MSNNLFPRYLPIVQKFKMAILITQTHKHAKSVFMKRFKMIHSRIVHTHEHEDDVRREKVVIKKMDIESKSFDFRQFWACKLS